MNRVEYAIKLYVKHLVKWDLYNLAIGLVNLSLISLFMVWAFAEHNVMTTAEVIELANIFERLILFLAAAPFVLTAVVIIVGKFSKRRGWAWDDELWPEVKI